jgi:hypothetical protein
MKMTWKALSPLLVIWRDAARQSLAKLIGKAEDGG